MNLVIITSCLNPIKKRLSYTNTRSIYTVEERFLQTLNTIKTIKHFIPNSYIVLLECSENIDTFENKFKNEVNEYYNYSNNPNVLKAVNCIYKNYGEVMTLLEFLNNCQNLNKFSNLFKITGRYWLNDNFKLSNYNYEDNIFLSIKQSKVVSTRFYKISNEYITTFKNKLSNEVKNDVMKGISIEHSFYNNLNYKHIDLLGLSGNISVNGDLIIE